VLIVVAREIIRETPLPKLVLVFSRPVLAFGVSSYLDIHFAGSCDRSLTNFKSKLLLLLSAKFNVTPTTGLLHHCWSPHYLLNG